MILIENLLIQEASIKDFNEDSWHIISPQEAAERKLFGPVYHGTPNIEKVKQEGLKYWVEDARQNNTTNGFPDDSNHLPVHFLGYGVYFTQLIDSAKRYGYGSLKTVVTAYLDIDPNKIETINFGAMNTMKKWYLKNGYDFELAKTDRVAATQKLTDNLKSKFDAVLFKGKGIHTLLDGNQLVLFDPTKIYIINPKLSKPIQAKILDPLDVQISKYGKFLKNKPELRDGWKNWIESDKILSIINRHKGEIVDVTEEYKNNKLSKIIKLEGKKIKVSDDLLEII